MNAEEAKKLTFEHASSTPEFQEVIGLIEISAKKGKSFITLSKKDYPLFSAVSIALLKEKGFGVHWGSDAWQVSWVDNS